VTTTHITTKVSSRHDVLCLMVAGCDGHHTTGVQIISGNNDGINIVCVPLTARTLIVDYHATDCCDF